MADAGQRAPPPPRIHPTSPQASKDPETPGPSPARMTHHRQSMSGISDNLRGVPQSPRARNPSLAHSIQQQGFKDLVDDPPVRHRLQNPWEGLDWKQIPVGEVVDPGEVHWTEFDSSVEDAAKLLVNSGPPNVVLVRESKNSHEAVATFDYADLNAYLLLVVGLSHSASDDAHAASFNELARKGRSGSPIPLRDIGQVGGREPLTTLPHTATLPEAVQLFGSGVHRIVIVKAGTKDAVGVLSQLRLVRFFWEFGRNFPSIENLFQVSLRDLGIGLRTVKSIHKDRPLTDALELMDHESLTSVPVLDNANNVMGNLSTVDVRLLTKSTSLPLLRSSCIHFISIILDEQGREDGQDRLPVFYVQHQSTLAHTVAKLVATRSHRMWIVDTPSPSGSNIQSPTTHIPSYAALPPATISSPRGNAPDVSATTNLANANALSGKTMSGRLTGVVSLTDVLNLFARASGLDPKDPEEARRMRRRSSSSSVRSRPSTDFGRVSGDLSRSGTGNVSSTSISGRDR